MINDLPFFTAFTIPDQTDELLKIVNSPVIREIWYPIQNIH